MTNPKVQLTQILESLEAAEAVHQYLLGTKEMSLKYAVAEIECVILRLKRLENSIRLLIPSTNEIE